jgi:hypothetical protein
VARATPAGWVAALAAVAVLGAAAPPASASTSAPSRRECGELRLTDTLPVPEAGQLTRRSVVVDGDCRVTYGRVEVLPTRGARVSGDKVRTYRTSSQMYDCCNILMNALTTAHTYPVLDGHAGPVTSTYGTHVNREPWHAGWTLEKVTQTGGSSVDSHAEFSYRGIFDPIGGWYHNSYDTSVTVAPDGPTSCRQSVTLRHTFVGWHWEHSCS